MATTETKSVEIDTARFKRVVVFNCPIITADGTFVKSSVDVETVKAWLDSGLPVVSSIGHDSTVEVINTTTDRPEGKRLKRNRMDGTQEVTDLVLGIKMSGRVPEGKILTKEELDAIGYSWFMLERIE